MKPKLQRWVVAFLFAAALCSALPAAAEVILQFFNNSWNEITEKIPELAEAGYGSLWLPPPQKGSGGLSVGYDLWDPFDLGGKDQRGSIKTRYGTEAELLRLIETAHRFGMRVYFDNIMNHRAFDVPGWDENTPIDIYPGMLPEDFHLRVTEEGYYRKWDNTVNWGSTWEVQYRNLSDLIDIAHETPNGNFGYTEGSSHPKISFVRHPDNPEYYDFHPTLGHVGFGSTNITAELIATNQDYYKEDVGGYLCRNVRWLIDYTKVDGLRLDAVKHVPSWFFGEQYDPNKDTNFAGYCGQAQWQFDQTRGFTDNNNNRDSVFDTELSFGRNDAMMFGEHMGEPPGYDEYFAAGMRLVDAKIHQTLNDVLGNPWRSLDGLQYPDYTAGYQFGQYQGVPYAKSHDDNVAYREELHYAINLTRAGLPNIYTDGNRQAETLGQSGGAFPRHANTAYLGQWGDGRIPNLVCIHDHFARSWQYPKWGDGDVVAYERVDKRENESMEDYDGVVLLTAVCDNYSEGCYREIPTSFPEGAYLWQYSTGGGNFYTTVSDGKIKVIVPPGGYFCFSWRSPEESDLWSGFDGDPVTIYENGEQAGWVSCERRDGPDGDPAFNPYGVSDPNAADFSYTFYVPRVTSATNLRFVARADGSTEDVLMKLDGGMNLNDQNHTSGDPRDYPPGNTGSFDVFLGYEKAHHVHMQYREKFAARDTTSNNVIGSAGAETYTCTIGSSGFTVNAGETGRDSDVDTAEWMYHDPAAQNAPTGDTGTVYYQFDPPPASAGGSPITVRVKSGYQFDINRMWFYYRTDTNGWPEGAGGEGWEQTQVAEMNWYYGTNDGQVMDWWQCQIGPFTNGTPLRYKVGGANCSTGSAGYPTINVYPNDTFSIDNKKSMLGIWEATNINLQTMVYRPHNDWGVTSTGLVDGFHVLRARAFLQRPGQASIYNTFVQTFYLDTETPQGEVVYPAEYDTLGDSEYGVVVRTDPSVQGVWFNISDSLSANDDGETGSAYGNGTNADGVAWVEAYKVTPSLSIESEYPDEWRFNYRNVPASGVATVSVRLVEISSSTNFSFSDSDGHYTTLLRHVNTAGPTQDVYVAWPPNDGDMIWSGYDLKVYFSKTLASGVDEATLRNRFLISINDSAQAKTNYWFQWDADAEHHALAYTLPDFYNGDSNFLHSVEVLHTNAGGAGVTLRATRLVRFRSTTTGPQVQIIDPPEVDGDGQPYRIVLPDVASPSSTQRQYTIRVETGLEALDCWIRFTNSVGYVVPFASTTNPLTGYVSVSAASTAVTGHPTNLSGTVAVTYSNTTVTGTGTAFSNELAAGNFIRVSTNVLVVTQVVSQTSLQISTPYPGANASGQTAYVLPAFEYEVSPSSRLLINTNYVTVTQILSSSNLTLSTGYPGPTASGLKAYRVDGQPTVSGSKKYWSFLWTNMTAGNFTLVAEIDTNGTPSTVEASATRNTTVIFREMVNSDTNDVDDDDDGLYDLYEISPTNLPTTNPETWVNGDVHIWQIYGRTDPLMPDTDGDGLPDGLELGWRGPLSGTATNTDTDGDGWPNFRQDVDPPFYNTVPDNGNTYGLPNYTFYGSRTELIHGTMTDPSNADSDYDGLPDGVEDGNRNGWVDGDGLPLNNTGGNPWDERTTLGDWPDGVWDSAWTETDPDNNDTDQDLGTDGYGEDTNFNGRIDGDTNSNRIWEAGELWTETDPLNPDTDGDNLPDGWEVRYSLDPFDCGIVGYTNLRTGLLVSNTTHGASGDPDADTISNLSEYLGGTNPRVADTNETPPESSIDIGRGDPIGELSGSGTNYAEFLDWTIEDCLVLDEYEGGGNNNQGGDLYYGWDGWDTSRDIIAFYARDGGDPTNGGDGKFYFRVDFYDLQANAEEGNLDLYVVIDTGNPA
ncbi:MAG: hypothetical protein JXB04_11350, partial [Kiritimatiellae bacterium]|nr:hypothetical protein [Kiritimatiellia bacterium]